MFTVLNIHN